MFETAANTEHQFFSLHEYTLELQKLIQKLEKVILHTTMILVMQTLKYTELQAETFTW